MPKENVFWFGVTPEGERLCRAIVDEMCRLFSISKEEATLRVNRHWGSQDGSRSVDFNNGLGGDPTYDGRFREPPEYWAKLIGYGPGVYWWLLDESKLKICPLDE